MKRISVILFLYAMMSLPCLSQKIIGVSNSKFVPAVNENSSYDVFVPIGKYLAAGDVESLSAWFANNLELSIFSSSNDCSRAQAKQVLKSFFKNYSPRSFVIRHQAGRENMKYALGDLNASGEHFNVIIFVTCPNGEGYSIRQLKIERLD